MVIVDETGKSAEHDTTPGAPIIVDLGTKPRKQVRRLRNGTGSLLAEVQGLVEQLKTSGTVEKNAQPIVVVVRQRRRRLSRLFPFV